jgi:hypothetical protein
LGSKNSQNGISFLWNLFFLKWLHRTMSYRPHQGTLGLIDWFIGKYPSAG